MKERRGRSLTIVPGSVSRLLRAAFTIWAVVLTVRSVQTQQRDSSPTLAATPTLSEASTGEAIYRAACITCHGRDGQGSSRATVGFETPLPDFTDCAFATAEADVDWHAVVHEGGRIRGLDRHMPAFGDALIAARHRRRRRLRPALLRESRVAAAAT